MAFESFCGLVAQPDHAGDLRRISRLGASINELKQAHALLADLPLK